MSEIESYVAAVVGTLIGMTISEEDWNKLTDPELERTKHVFFKTPSGKRVEYIRVDVLDEIRSEIESTLYVDSLIFGELMDFKEGKIGADDVIEEFNQVTRKEVLGMIDKYKSESEE